MVVAADEQDVIGRDGALPWHLPDDLRRFRRLTTGHVVLLGRRTHDSILARLGHPLPGRISVVVTRQTELRNDGAVLVQPDVDSALGVARAVEEFAGRDEVMVIGGAEIYARTLDAVTRIHLTRVHGHFDGDTRLPAGWLDGFDPVAEEIPAAPGCTYLTYERR